MDNLVSVFSELPEDRLSIGTGLYNHPPGNKADIKKLSLMKYTEKSNLLPPGFPNLTRNGTIGLKCFTEKVGSD